MTRLAFFLIVTLTAAALAQTSTDRDHNVAPASNPTRNADFNGVPIDGVIQTPPNIYVSPPLKPHFGRLFRVRDNFNDKLKDAAEIR